MQLPNTLSIYEVADAIKAQGALRTVLVQGDMGSGKSSILKLLSKDLPNHVPLYFDCTTKDLGDLMVPMFDKIDDRGGVRYALNEELGFHYDKPVILMLDEYGKASPSVKLGLTRLALERKIGNRELPKGSIVFMTTNLGAEGVGDLLLAHQRNRISVITMRKSEVLEWCDWAFNNGVDHSVIGWVKENPQVMQSFIDVKEDPMENPYIFHPQDPSRTSFVTPRSLEAASDWIKVRDQMSNNTLKQVLAGTIGVRAAHDMFAWISLADELPTLEELKKDPMNAPVPTSASAVAMTVYRTMAVIEYPWVDNWMLYLGRLTREAQGLFVNGVRREKYGKRDVVTNCKGFQDWCMANNWMHDK